MGSKTNMSQSEDKELEDLLNLVGPKRVDTKELDIHAHDPMVIQKLLERRKSKPVFFHQFGFSQVARHGAEKTCPKRFTSDNE